MREVRIGMLRFEGVEAKDGGVQLIIRSELGQQECRVSVSEWASMQTVPLVLKLSDDRAAKDRSEIARLDIELQKLRTKLEHFQSSAIAKDPANG